MNLIKPGIVGAMALSMGLLAACDGGPEGKYSLDKAEVKKAMTAKAATMPKAEQAFANMFVGLIDQMEFDVELQSDGKLQAKTKEPSMDKDKPGKSETKTGTWKKDGEKLILTVDGKPMTCSLNGKSLSCADGKADEPPLVFIKS